MTGWDTGTEKGSTAYEQSWLSIQHSIQHSSVLGAWTWNSGKPELKSHLCSLLMAEKGFKLKFLGDSDGKESASGAGDPGSIPGSGEGNGYPLQYSYLESSMDRGTWRATVHGVTKGRTQLSE